MIWKETRKWVGASETYVRTIFDWWMTVTKRECAENEKRQHHSFAIRFITPIHRIWYFISFHFCVCVDFSIHLCEILAVQAKYKLYSAAKDTNDAWVRSEKKNTANTHQTDDQSELNVIQNEKSLYIFIVKCKEASLMFHHSHETEENSSSLKWKKWEEKNICSAHETHSSCLCFVPFHFVTVLHIPFWYRKIAHEQ